MTAAEESTPRIEWTPKLRTTSQRLLEIYEEAVIKGQYSKDSFRTHLDDMTLAQVRAISDELKQELSRLSHMKDRVAQLKTSIRQVAGL